MKRMLQCGAMFLVGLLLLAGLPLSALAGPAAPEILEIAQPDGNSFAARLQGDEWSSFVETAEGYTVAEDSGGTWRYVSFYNGDQPLLSDIPAHQPPVNIPQQVRPLPEFIQQGPPNAAELVQQLERRQRMSAVAGSAESIASAASIAEAGPSGAPFGTHNGAVLFILASFSNQAGTYSEASFASFISNNIADYFSKASHGKATLVPASESFGTANNGVVGWVNVGTAHPNSGSNTGAANQTLTANAIAAADPYVNYAAYDKNFDGYVDADELAVVVIAAGYERSSGTLTPNVWGHKWSLSTPVSADGVTVGAYHNGKGGYAQFGERQGDHQATAGIMVHELGHLIYGLPDLYDTDYSAKGIGSWCVMSGGSWGKRSEDAYSGQTPVMPSAWVRYTLGWVDAAEGAGATSIRAAGSTTASSANTVYKLTTGTSGEFFLVENRQPLGYDEGLEGTLGNNFSGGLAIWHIDENKTGNSAEWYPGLGATNHLKVALEQADGLWQLEKNQSSGNTADLYRSGSTFTATTTPDSKLYSGSSSLVEVTSVSASAETMTASLASSATPCGAPASLTVPASSSGSIALSWAASSTSGVSYEVQEAGVADFSSGVVTVYLGAATSTNLAKTANATHYYRVRATKPGYASSAWTNGSGACTVTLPTAGTPVSLTVPANDGSGSYSVSWGASATAGASYELQEATDAGFSANLKTIYSGTATAFLVTGNGDGSYYYRVRATKTAYNPSAWRTTGNGCVVNLTCLPPGTLTVPAASATGRYLVSWTPSPTAGVIYELQESTDPTFASALRTLYSGAYPGWTIAYQGEGSYYYRVRAIKDQFAASAWRSGGNACAVAGTACGLPALISVPSSDTTGLLKIIWGLSATKGAIYELEEATDAAFSSGLRLLYRGTGRAFSVPHAANGTFYYRVRATLVGVPSSAWVPANNPATITLTCGAPVKMTIPAVNTTGTYTVSWTASNIKGVTYELEQATNASFTTGKQVVYSGIKTSVILNQSTDASYYYRVRAAKSGYATSVWTLGANSCAAALTCGTPKSISYPKTSSSGNFAVSWGASNLKGVTYTLEQSPAADFGSGVQVVYSGSAVKINIASLANGTYYYRVRAALAGYASSDWKTTTWGCLVTLVASDPVPSLSVPASSATGTFDLTWTASGQTGVTYEVEEATNAAFTTGLRQAYRGTALKVTVKVAENASYYYRVRATKTGFLPSAWKTSSAVAVSAMAPIPALSSLTVPAANTTGSVILSWAKTSMSGVYYEVEEATNASFTTGLRQVYKGSGLKATVKVEQNGSYYYRVRANRIGYDPTNWVTAGNPCAVTLICGAPTFLTVPVSNSTGLFTVSWGVSDVAGIVYELEMATNAAFTTGKVALYQGTGRSYKVSAPADGTYYFRVRAIKAGYADSGWSAGTNACAVGQVCGKPTSITYPKLDSTGAVKVSWGASNILGVSYELELSDDAGFSAPLLVYQGSARFTTLTLTSNATYYFRVRATKAGYADSAWTTVTGNYGCVVTLACSMPASLTVPKASTTGTYTLSWAASKVAGAYYVLERATNTSFVGAVVVYVGPEIKFVQLSQGSGTYYYRVKAFKEGYADSDWKAGALPCVVTLP